MLLNILKNVHYQCQIVYHVCKSSKFSLFFFFFSICNKCLGPGYQLMLVALDTHTCALKMSTYVHTSCSDCIFITLILSMNVPPHDITQTHKCWEQAWIYKLGLLTFGYLQVQQSSPILLMRIFGRPSKHGLHTNTHTILCATCMSDHSPVAKLHYECYTHNWAISVLCDVSCQHNL